MNTIKIELVSGGPVYYVLKDGYSYEVVSFNAGTNANQIQVKVKDELGTDVETVTIAKPDLGTQDNWDKSHEVGSNEVANRLGVSQTEIVNAEMAEAWSTAFDAAIKNGSATYKEWIYFMDMRTAESIGKCRDRQLDDAEQLSQSAIQAYQSCGDPGAPQEFKGPGGVIIKCGQFPQDPNENIRNIALAVSNNGVSCFDKFGGDRKHMCSLFESVTITPAP